MLDDRNAKKHPTTLNQPNLGFVRRREKLCQGIVRDESRRQYEQVIEALAEARADSVMLGCPEVTMLIGQSDTVLPVFDTTAIHVAAEISSMMGS